MTPWLAFALIVVGLAASIVGSLLHVGGGAMGVALGVATVGLAYLQARAHRDAERAYVQLRASMRPPPTLPDAKEAKGASGWTPPRG